MVSLAQRHGEFLDTGVRLYAVSVDPPRQNSAMIEKLHLPFPFLSDPDRDRMIGPLGVSDEHDPRRIARPAMILVRPGGEEAWRFVSRDFADRLPEDEVLEQARTLELPATSQEPPTTGDPEPGPKAMPLTDLPVYFRGAKFAAKAMGLRHPAAKDDADRLFDQMDGYMRVVREFREATGA
ncbi:MAG: peroxiredoxin family protein [Actinobacteria bacterium]|nr:peroxiredoxin family protein [Actinomycetota bacterium]